MVKGLGVSPPLELPATVYAPFVVFPMMLHKCPRVFEWSFQPTPNFPPGKERHKPSIS